MFHRYGTVAMLRLHAVAPHRFLLDRCRPRLGHTADPLGVPDDCRPVSGLPKGCQCQSICSARVGTAVSAAPPSVQSFRRPRLVEAPPAKAAAMIGSDLRRR